MSYSDFVHLRTHSAYSLSEGAMSVNDLAEMAQRYRTPAVALTDSGNMFGTLEFSSACRQRGIQPIIGCQLGLSVSEEESFPVVALARNEKGLLNLRKLSTEGYLVGSPSRPFSSLDFLCDHAEGIFLLTGGVQGPLGHFLLHQDESGAKNLLGRLSESFRDNLAVELTRVGVFGEKIVESDLVDLADQFSLPLVATNDCFFSSPRMRMAQDVLLCIGEGQVAAEEDRKKAFEGGWFKSPQEMRELFKDIPEACDNSLMIARRCHVEVSSRKPLLPISKKVGNHQDSGAFLSKMARDGLKKRLEVMKIAEDLRKVYEERLEHEINIIIGMGFPGYFLIVADFIQWAKAHDIPVGPGRGSGAGSLVAYALTITDIDPIRFSLLFERFLNPERVSMPDFDIDFCQHRRDEVIRYVRDEYGANRVAQIITFGKLQAKAAVRDVGRVLGLSYGAVNRIAELIPNNPAKPIPLRQAIAEEPELQKIGEKQDEDEAVLLETALQLEGLFRHASTHAAGVVIGDRDLVELVPLYRDPRDESGMLVTQFSMKNVEKAGLVKFDFLGLATLTLLKRGMDFLKELGIDVDLSQIPLDDPKTFEMMAKGDTVGIFQFESPGMRDMLKQMQSNRFEDLIAGVALYRPGPMENIPSYCRRKHGEEWIAPHESIRPILEETYGIMVYQEQVMQIAQEMAGYSLGEADILRRAMGKKIAAEMEQQRQIFIKGAVAKGISESDANSVFDLMAKFADYGFNKSHAAAYALVSYQTAWMKAHHPVAFLAACMSLSREKTEKLSIFCQEAERMNIKVMPPDINHSKADFSVEKTEEGEYIIRYALAAVKRVGLTAMEALCAARGKTKFSTLTDFSQRCSGGFLNKIQLENLAKAGAFDCFSIEREVVCENIDLVLARAQAQAADKASGQTGLFGSFEETIEFSELSLKTPPVMWKNSQRLQEEALAIGFYLTEHPLESYENFLKKMHVTPISEIENLDIGSEERILSIAGIVVQKKERPTRSGKKMAWLTLSDSQGICEFVMFSETLEEARPFIKEGEEVFASISVRKEEEALRLTARRVTSLEMEMQKGKTKMLVFVSGEAGIQGLKEKLDMFQGGAGRIALLFKKQNDQFILELPGFYRTTPKLLEQIKILPEIDAKIKED
ncbi:DNA polymerase III subunit alpha [Acetobacteraceae bacterium]|nr:DNA polymerase III subunit alpha [Acetobacteraceae bacterium]